MKRLLALTGVACSPLSMLVLASAVPKVAGILLALLQLGSNIGFGTLFTVYASLFFFPGGFLLPIDFVFLL